QVFNYIIDRVWKKLKGWKEKHLSFASRGTLIKAVVQVIPTYIMSCFLLPKGLCKQLESMACNFWWGSNTDRRKIHWVNWKKICKHKNRGGLGFRNSCMFNEALLAEQGWRISTQPESLVARVLKAKYFPKCHFMEAKISNISSYTWRSILQARWILKKGCFWTIGNGDRVNIWEDNWLPHQNGFKVWSKNQGNLDSNLVKDLIDPTTQQWNQNLINQIFLPFEAQQICQLPLVDTNAPDELTWFGTKEGVYTVKSGYHAVMNWNSVNIDHSGSHTLDTDPIWNHLWKQKITPKQTSLVWRILNKALPVSDNLSSKGIKCNPVCLRCNKGLETIDHVFMQCDWAKAVWFGSPMTINFNSLERNLSFTEWLSTVITNGVKECIAITAALNYNIWRARNLLVFQEKNIPVMSVIQQAMASSMEYQSLGSSRQIISKSSAPGSRGNNINWTPPPNGALKLN
ncbi:putative ribonuclease H protein, partial [Trifolium medium]|nr:putative ribonuclease H protein [Trifolium medium]